MAEQKDLHSWLMSLVSFEVKVLTALTEETQRLAVLEKKQFLLENGLDQDLPEIAFKDLCAFALADEQRIQRSNVFEILERKFAINYFETKKLNHDPILYRIKLRFLDGINYFKKESENHVREKNQKSIPYPA